MYYWLQALICFLCGITMMIIFWAITPLRSTIFGTGSVTRTRVSQMATIAAIQRIESQVYTFDSNFLMTAYGISWLDEQVPEFTMKSYAVQPLAPVQGASIILSTETWSASVEAYSINLTCTPAKRTHILLYIGYYDDYCVDWALANSNCSLEFSNNFLAIWASSASMTANGTYGNMTALFCETSCVGQPFPGSNLSAFELVTAMHPLVATTVRLIEDNQESEGILVTGWARLGSSPVQGTSNLTASTTSNRSLESIFLSCHPILQTALFNVIVDSTGRITSIQRQTAFNTDFQPFFNGTTDYELANRVEFMTNQT